MREAEIRFDIEVPVEVQLAMLPIVQRELWLAPSWLELIYFKFDDNNAGSALSASPVEEYRKLIISIRSNWLKSESEERVTQVRHEIIHAIVDPIYQTAWRLVSALEDKKLRDWAEEELRVSVEKATVDLEYALKRRNVQ
jgi:hypothetical protein